VLSQVLRDWLNRTDTREQSHQAIERYRTQIVSWYVSQGLELQQIRTLLSNHGIVIGMRTLQRYINERWNVRCRPKKLEPSQLRLTPHFIRLRLQVGHFHLVQKL
jgi:hypothetical protein